MIATEFQSQLEELRAFWDRCQRVDWFGCMSDDSNCWRRAESEQATLRAEANGPKREIYEAWRQAANDCLMGKVAQMIPPPRP